MAKIAVELEQALARRAESGTSGGLEVRVLGEGNGWKVADIVCTSGPRDRSFEERHSQVAIAIVAAGSFQYASSPGRELMTPGSLLLGNHGQWFECGHHHSEGDRCLAFQYAPDYFESLAADAGVRGTRPAFPALRLPPLRELSPLVARAFSGLLASADSPANGSFAGLWEELAVQLAAQALRIAGGSYWEPGSAPPSALARVTRTVRAIERNQESELGLGSLAREAGLSPYHFLRTFQRLTGVTPHQYIMRARLREAAARLPVEPAKILDIALDCGFGDLSNFNRAFRAEYGMSPRTYRRAPVALSPSEVLG